MDIIDLVEALGTWTWWVIAAILLVAELMAPGVFFLWLAFSAASVGAISLVIEWSWEAQIATFSVLSVASLIGSRMFLQKMPIETDRPFLNRRADRLVGRTFLLVEAIENGEGRVRVADTLWQARGPDLAKGTMVRVIEVEGGVLVVEPVEAADP
ncbi:Putative activity regulator of membrane protease YbbK [hydrothermal vent metagenome]|uniref:Activity regulator of membrane protease YbbK n=1 Tax=hydrothermal vent metagenome TaxID=652676 RepID=A0A3B0U4G9_9ZZZZ